MVEQNRTEQNGCNSILYLDARADYNVVQYNAVQYSDDGGTSNSMVERLFTCIVGVQALAICGL